MGEHVRTSRWPLALAVVLAVTTAALLAAAIAASGDAKADTLIISVALAMLLALVATGGFWAAELRRSAPDPLVERAETASKIAHELKNPLASIKGLASTGVKLFESMSEEERREFFRLIDEEASRLRLTIDQSATALKIDAGSLSYDLRPEDVGRFVEDVAWRAPYGEHPVVVETETGVVVPLDRLRLTEAVENVLDNASKFSPPDAPIEIRVSRDGDGSAVIEVADRGPGIPPDQLGAVMEKFAAWRPAGYEETPGAGLGLFIARAHVAAHGGRMTLEERDEGGTMLRITIPEGG